MPALFLGGNGEKFIRDFFFSRKTAKLPKVFNSISSSGATAFSRKAFGKMTTSRFLQSLTQQNLK
jgi:hypothetical protein